MSETITQTQPEQESPKLAVTQEQMNVLEQLLKPEVQESLTVLVTVAKINRACRRAHKVI